MFRSIGTWLVQLVHDWTNEFLSWLAIYVSFIAACLIIVAIALGLHLVWRILPARWPLLILGVAGLIVWGVLGNPAGQLPAGFRRMAGAVGKRGCVLLSRQEQPEHLARNHDVGGRPMSNLG